MKPVSIMAMTIMKSALLKRLNYNHQVFNLIITAMLLVPKYTWGKTNDEANLCYRQIQQAVKKEQVSLLAAQKVLEAQLMQARQRLNIPKSPQLRTRFESAASALTWEQAQARIGLRWYFPKFLSTQEALSSISRFKINEEDLSKYWLKLKQQSRFITKLRDYIADQALIKKQRFFFYQEKLIQAEIDLNQSLLESGMSTLLTQQVLQKKYAQVQRQKSKANLEWTRFRLKASWLSALSVPNQLSPDDLKVFAEEQSTALTTCLPFITFEQIKSLSNQQSQTKALQHLSLKELEALIQVTLQEQKQRLSKHQWLEFIELNYDRRVNDQRMIAELGINLPIATYSQAEHFKSQHYVQKLDSLRLERQQALSSLNQSKVQKLFQKIFKVKPPLNTAWDLSHLEGIKQAHLELELWYLGQREYQEREQLLLDYLSLFPSFSIQSLNPQDYTR